MPILISPYHSTSDLMVTAPLGPNFSLLSAMPGRKKWVDRKLIFQPSGVNLAYILQHWPEAEWTGSAKKVRDSYIELKMQEDNIRAEKLENLSDSSGYQHKTVPFQHQQHAFLLSRDLRTFALFHEQGCGKTKVIIDTAAYLWEQGRIDTLIVIAPNGVHINWVENEIPAHMPERIQYQSQYYSSSLSPKKLKLLADAAKVRGPLRIITFNVEGFVSEKARSLLETWLQCGISSMVVVDESSRIGNHSAKRTKYLLKTCRVASYRRIMTGTPITRGVENLYSQFGFLDPRILGHNSFWTFRNEYCVMGGFEGRQIVSYKNTDELTRIVDGHSHRVLKKDCLDLPSKIYRRHPFEMSGSQRRLYDAFRKDSLDEIIAVMGEEEGMKRAKELAVVKFLRLHQVACGITPTEVMERLSGTNPRMEATLEEIEEGTASEGKLIVWARFRLDLEEIFNQLGPKKAVAYWGDIPKAQRELSLRRFQDDDRVRVIVGHVQALGIGFNLTRASGALYHSNVSNLEFRLQSEDRCHRIGSEGFSNIVYTDIEAIRSVDRKIINTLIRRKSLADQITKDPASLFLLDAEEEPVFQPDLSAVELLADDPNGGVHV